MAFQDVPFQVRVGAVNAGVDHCHSHSAPGALIPELRELVIVNPVLALAHIIPRAGAVCGRRCGGPRRSWGRFRRGWGRGCRGTRCGGRQSRVKPAGGSHPNA